MSEKTCATCADAFLDDIPCCVPVMGCEDVRAFYREKGCKYYTPRIDTLEQRYEQLSKVAKTMHKWLLGIAQGRWSVEIEEVDDIGMQLEELGVRLDD